MPLKILLFLKNNLKKIIKPFSKCQRAGNGQAPRVCIPKRAFMG